MTRRTLLGIASAAAFSVSMAQAAEPVRQIGIYVQPYYEAAREPGGTPRVAVGRSFAGLARRLGVLVLRREGSLLTLGGVVDVATGGLAQVEQAVRDFAMLAGPFINGYAFCDVANQQAIRAKALDWVEKNSYEAMFMERLPAKSSNRRQALVKAHALIRDNAAKERAYLQDPANVAKLRADRAANGADDKYCWK